MSITASLQSALSGLNATSRMAGVVSSNIANALTDGYARRELLTSSRMVGDTSQGVSVDGIRRIADMVLIGDRRVAQANADERGVRADVLRLLEQAIGTPESEGSIGNRIAQFETALIAATSRPESEARLSNVADTAKALARTIGQTSDQIQTARMRADDQIGVQVQVLNDALVQVADLNVQIRTFANTGRDASTLVDQRQLLVDKIAGIVPVREVPREHGQIGLFTTGGAVLLEGTPVTLGFTSVGIITPDMTIASGALSGLTINGSAVPTDANGRMMAGGSLAAQFAVRDQLATDTQSQLDAVARDLVERMSAPGLDATRPSGAPGLFTDGGGSFLPINEVGLAQRIRLNAAADPQQGGSVSRLRDGLGATTTGPVGSSALLTAWHDTLAAARPLVSGGFQTGPRNFASLASDMLSGISAKRLTAEAESSFSAARAQSLRTLELEDGIDTDKEMQDLLMVEQAFAANARVIKTVDELIQILIGL